MTDPAGSTSEPMKAIYLFLLAQSELLPLIVGLVRYRRLGKTYRPFLLMLAFAVLNQQVTYIFLRTMHFNSVPNNIYGLLEWILIAWQFHVWGLLRNNKRVFYLLVVMVSLIWVVEDIVLGGITDYPPYFQVFDAFVIVLMSVGKINFMITHDDRSLRGNPIFLICIGFIILFIYEIVLEWAYQMSLQGATETTTRIIYGFGYVDVLVNIIFAVALLRIPHPQKFTLN
jgi:hypothetical protein